MKATCAPSCMATRTTPAPIPREPPVTSIRFPSSNPMGIVQRNCGRQRSVGCHRKLLALGFFHHYLVAELAIALLGQQRLNHRGVKRTVAYEENLVRGDLREIPFLQRVPHAGELLVDVQSERTVEIVPAHLQGKKIEV